MNYPILSLKQNLIDEVFSGAKYRINKYDTKKYQKKYDKIQKALRLQSGLVEECDQCEFKTSKFKAMYRHKREKHLVLKQKCTDCNYSNIYPNRIKQHINQVHRGMKRRRSIRINEKNIEKCRRESCEYAGKQNCSELQSHSLYFCKQCQLSFERNYSLKFHNNKIHEGLVFKCRYCYTYSTASENSLKRHILSKHPEDQPKKSRVLRFCKEEGCTHKTFDGQSLKRHIEAKHEGIVRFKCHVMNCSFRSSEQKELRRHAKTHEKTIVEY